MKTDTQANVGKHAFEVAGLGAGPFRFVGMRENAIQHADGTSQAGGTCDYCGTGIRFECCIRSADGKMSVVGTDCINKVGDAGLLKAYKTSAEFRTHQAKLRHARAQRIAAECRELIAKHADALRAQPHPRGFTNRETGVPLTHLDYVEYMFNACGAAGTARLTKWLKAFGQ